jgi:hypothetical protein
MPLAAGSPSSKHTCERRAASLAAARSAAAVADETSRCGRAQCLATSS